MSSMAITILIIAFLAVGALSFMWKLSRILLIPLRIAIFLALVFVVWKAFATKDNVNAIHSQVENSELPEMTKRIVEKAKSEVSATVSGDRPAVSAEKTAGGEKEENTPSCSGETGSSPKPQKTAALPGDKTGAEPVDTSEEASSRPVEAKSPVGGRRKSQETEETAGKDQKTDGPEAVKRSGNETGSAPAAQGKSGKPAKQSSVFDDFDNLNLSF